MTTIFEWVDLGRARTETGMEEARLCLSRSYSETLWSFLRFTRLLVALLAILITESLNFLTES